VPDILILPLDKTESEVSELCVTPHSQLPRDHTTNYYRQSITPERPEMVENTPRVNCTIWEPELISPFSSLLEFRPSDVKLICRPSLSTRIRHFFHLPAKSHGRHRH